jgi:peptidyl-tRNA hydrolase
MKLKILYRKCLNMTPGKLAAQCVHAATGIGHGDYSMSVVVLGVSTAKFEEAKTAYESYVVRDAGYTEVEPGTETCLAYYEAGQ